MSIYKDIYTDFSVLPAHFLIIFILFLSLGLYTSFQVGKGGVIILLFSCNRIYQSGTEDEIVILL